MNYRFQDGEDTWTREGSRTVRILKRATLDEVSRVAESVSPQTTVALHQALNEAIAEMLAARRHRLDALVK